MNLQIGELEKSPRRYDVDWLRVILFGLLIWFHYVVFSLVQIEENDGNMRIVNSSLLIVIEVMHQWRLAALFVISGMGTSFAFRRRTWKTYVAERGARLGIPLLFGTYILWLGIIDPIKTTARLFTIFIGADNIPYGHLWFIYNLLIYSFLLTPLFAHVRNNPEGKVVHFLRSVFRIRHGLGIMLIPPLILAVNGILFKPWEFGEVGMWWEFPRYLLYFLFGYLMITAKDEYFQVIDQIRIPVTILMPILTISWFLFSSLSGVPAVMEGGWVRDGHPAFSIDATIASLLQSFHAWFWCLFIFSWASKLLNRSSIWLTYLNEAVYPAYIVHLHLTFFSIAVFEIIGTGYYVGLTFGAIFVMVGVMICFEISRRARFVRPLFGINRGTNEVEKLFPYNQTENPSVRILFSILFHILSIGMTTGLLILLISASILGAI
jgi:glucan biosynthesis protein C